MPIRSQDPVLRFGDQLATESTAGEEMGAAFSEALQSGPIGSLLRMDSLDEAQNGRQQSAYSRGRFGDLPSQNRVPSSPVLSQANAGQRLRDEGLEKHLIIPDTGIRRAALDILIDRKREELKRQTIMEQSPGGGARISARVASSFVGSLVDPSNVALAFVPVVGEARYAVLLGRAGGISGRSAVRVGVGAAEGVVGGAIAEPLNYAANAQQQADYDAYDSMTNIAGGAFFGAALHGGAGLFGDMLRPGKWNTAPMVAADRASAAPAAAAPESAPMRQQDPVQMQVERERAIVMDRLAEGRPVTREQALEMARANVSSVEAPRFGPASPVYSVSAETKGGEFRLVDEPAPAGTDFSEFGEVRQVTAYDGDTPVGKLVYANDGTPPTIEVDDAYRRRGIATAMNKLAKERGGVLGDPRTGIRGRGAEYRTADGQAFREGADDAAVTLRRTEDIEAEADRLLGASAGEQPLSAVVRKAIAEDRFANVRPVIAALPGEVQQGMFRMAMAQALTGRPIDVTPALFTHYGDIDGGAAAAMRNAGEVAGADRMASAAADRRLSDAPQNEDLATITEAADESESLMKEQAKAAGLKKEDIADMIEEGAAAVRQAKAQANAYKIAALCSLRAG